VSRLLIRNGMILTMDVAGTYFERGAISFSRPTAAWSTRRSSMGGSSCGAGALRSLTRSRSYGRRMRHSAVSEITWLSCGDKLIPEIQPRPAVHSAVDAQKAISDLALGVHLRSPAGGSGALPGSSDAGHRGCS
jgi:hypothetical protein